MKMAVHAALLLTIVAVSPARAQTAEASATTQPAEPKSDFWHGILTLPTGKLDLVVAFHPGEQPGEFTGTLDIPLQGVRGAPLTNVRYGDDRVEFGIPGTGATFVGRRWTGGEQIKGELEQQGLRFDLSFERVTEEKAQTVGPDRPQTPKPPFPYTARDVTYNGGSADITLGGTLTVPPGEGPHPAVLLITGSGAQDRDESLFGHKPFLVLADAFSRRGMAVLRVDDRGVGESTGRLDDASLEDLTDDVLAGVKWLQQQPEIDGERIALLGHSEGGLLALRAAAENDDISGLVLLSTPALSGAETLQLQLRALLKAVGYLDRQIELESEAQRVLLEYVLGKADQESLRSAAARLVDLQLRRQARGQAPPPEMLNRKVDETLRTMATPWMNSYLRFEPATVLDDVACPVLILGGTKDQQVPTTPHVDKLKRGLAAGGNERVTVAELDGLNHLLQEAERGLPAEYPMIEQTIAPAALAHMHAWLRAQLDVEPAATQPAQP